MSITNSFIAGNAVQIGSVGGNVTLALDRPDYQVQWLAPTPPPTYTPQRHRTPSSLLDTKREVVPYLNRAAEEQRLLDWLATDAPSSVLLLHGAGGRGKTRLANAFAAHSHATGWSVAHALNRVTDKPWMLPTGTSNTSTPGHGVLVAVDYAERWPADVLLTLITDLSRTHATEKVRVLLLARSIQDLWQPLCDQLDRTPIELPEPIELVDLTDSPNARAAAFTEAAQAFHTALGLAGACPTAPPDLAHDDYASPLILHMTALAAVCAERDHEELPHRDELSGYLLAHERRSWPPHPNGGDAVFLATLFGPVVDESGALMLLDIAGIAGSSAAARDLLVWHDRVYPSPRDLPPLLPDRFGEDFVADHLRMHARAAAQIERVIGSSEVGPGMLRRCTTVLVATASRHAHVRKVLWELLSQESYLHAFPTAGLVRMAIADAPFPAKIMISASLPRPEVGLRELGLELALEIERSLPDDVSPLAQVKLRAALLHRLEEAGPDNELVPVLMRSIMQTIADASEHDKEAYTLPATQVLMHLSDHLARTDDLQGALDNVDTAVEILRDATAVDLNQRLTYLVFALTKRARLQRQLQRANDAVDSASEAMAFAEQVTNDEAELQNLASATVFLCEEFTVLGEAEGAVRAARRSVAAYLTLARVQPEVYAEQTALGLNNLACALFAAGSMDEAARAVFDSITVTRQFLPFNPGVFEPLLPRLLHHAAWIQVHHVARGGDPQARDLIEEAVTLYRSHPDLKSKLEEALTLQREIESS